MNLDQALQATRATLPTLVRLSAHQRNAVLLSMAAALRADSDSILAANRKDVATAEASGQSAALIDRLALDPSRLQQLADAVAAIAELPDPLATHCDEQVRPDGLRIRRQAAPLGVIAMIYESRPNVTADAAALCFKSANACLLRGGREARNSNLAIAASLHRALAEHGISSDCLRVLDDPDRSQLNALLMRDDLIDLVIPRGGEALIRHVAENSRIPVIRHYKGVCHLFVERRADQDQALRLLIDGKTSRPGVCNALECLLIDAPIAESFLPRVAAALTEHAVSLRACERSLPHLSQAQAAEADDWGREYLDRILAVKVVDGLDAALDHIRRYGSHHTEVICSENIDASQRFVREVDASAVMVNASSRFNDGGQLGLGAEIGISTTKLHAYGPMGLQSLTCFKWVVEGQGQIRHPAPPAH